MEGALRLLFAYRCPSCGSVVVRMQVMRLSVARPPEPSIGTALPLTLKNVEFAHFHRRAVLGERPMNIDACGVSAYDVPVLFAADDSTIRLVNWQHEPVVKARHDRRRNARKRR
jgi:hypothetical protein